MQTNREVSRWFGGLRRKVILFLFFAAVVSGHLSAGTISFQVTNQGGNVFQYEFFPSGFGLLQHQELDIRFDPSLFGSLSDGVADDDFHLALLQPNNPVGAFGDYSALALLDSPSFAGPFSVDVSFLGAGAPGGLPYVIHQFDSTGQRIAGTIDAGTLGVPEPAGRFLGGVGLSMVGLLRTVCRRR